jgi:hypothetical protein
MITVNDLKAKYQLYKVSKLVSDRIFDKWESDIDDEELEQFSDNAYRGMWDALDDFATSLEEFTSGQVDFATARKMAINPRFSDRLDDLMSRLTA